MERYGAANSASSKTIILQQRQAFLASKAYVSEPCYLCGMIIGEHSQVQYYGGPFIMHSACIDKRVNGY